MTTKRREKRREEGTTERKADGMHCAAVFLSCVMLKACSTEQPRDWITESLTHLAVDDRLWALLYITFVRGWKDTKRTSDSCSLQTMADII